MADPLAYFITFRTYGTFLQDDERGSISRRNNTVGAPREPIDAGHVEHNRNLMTAPEFVLDPHARTIVDAAIRERCDYAGWTLLALNVRTNHVHVVLSASEAPERVMTSLKAWSTRALRSADIPVERAWSRHGSTRYLADEDSIQRACIYVLEMQDGKSNPAGRRARAVAATPAHSTQS